jgi:hypothetical protein
MRNWHGNLSPFGSWHTGGRVDFSPASLFSLNEPGVWFDPSDVASLDWRRNRLTWSESFDNAAWTKPAGTTTVTANTATAPDGTMTADLVTATAGSACHYVFQTNSSSVSVTFSVYAKAGTANWLGLGSGYTNGTETAWFDLTNGTVGTVAAGGTASIVSAGNGWWRCSHTRASWTGAGALAYVTNANGVAVFNAVGTENLLLWGAQLELGSTATDYQRITDVNTEIVERFPNATLYQDVAGTIPVTGPTNLAGNASTVALMLDKSKGLALGSELVVNGDFSSGTGWSLGAGWSISGGKLNWAGAFDRAEYNAGSNAFVAGRYYKVTLTVSGNTSGTVVAFLNLTGNARINSFSISGNGEKTFFLFAGVNCNGFILEGNSATGAMSLDDISVRELPGNHATQGTIASRPTYGVVPQGGRRNLLLATDNFVTSLPGTVATSNNQSPTGALNAYGFTENTDNTQRSAAGFNTATGQTRSFFVRRTAGTSTRYLAILATNVAAGGAFFNLATGTVTTNNPANFTATIQLVGDFWRCSITRVDAVNSDLMLCITSQNTVYSGSQAYAGDGVSKFVIWGAQLEAGSAVTNYQSVTTQYDVTEAGVPSCSYLFFDGGSDFMSTSTITPGVDKVQVFAGLRKLSDAVAMVAEFSADFGNNAGSFGAYTFTDFRFASRGTATEKIALGGPVAPSTQVFTGLGDISGDTSTLRLNSVQVGQSTLDQGTGNYLAYPLYIGRRNATTNLYFNGELFGLITRFGANLTPQQITSTEQWLAPKTTFFRPVITGVPTVGVS